MLINLFQVCNIDHHLSEPKHLQQYYSGNPVKNWENLWVHRNPGWKTLTYQVNNVVSWENNESIERIVDCSGSRWAEVQVLEVGPFRPTHLFDL